LITKFVVVGDLPLSKMFLSSMFIFFVDRQPLFYIFLVLTCFRHSTSHVYQGIQRTYTE